jgi:hypothetical protein
MSAMCVAEFLLWAVLAFLFWKKGFHRSFPAMGYYLALNLAASPVLGVLLFTQSTQLSISITNPYFSHYAFYVYTFWAVYIANSVLFFFVCIEIIRSALSGFSELKKSAVVTFRWVALLSAIVSLSTANFEHRNLISIPMIIPEVAYRLMRSVSIVELCLLAFLCLSMKALHLSVRDMSFGIAVGFALMSSSDLLISSFISRKTSLIDPIQFVKEGVLLSALGIWIAYSALPMRARNPMERAGDLICS